MSKRILVLFGILFTINSFGQGNQKYKDLVNDARKLNESKEYLKSAQKYSEAFKLSETGALTQDRIAADFSASWRIDGARHASLIPAGAGTLPRFSFSSQQPEFVQHQKRYTLCAYHQDLLANEVTLRMYW